jgi:hypothetical protein
MSVLSRSIYVEAQFNPELSCQYFANCERFCPLRWCARIQKSVNNNWWYVSPGFLAIIIKWLSMWSSSLLAMRQTSRTTLNGKKAKYRELVRQLDENFDEVNFVNHSMSSLGIFAQECSTFSEMLGNVGLDKNYQTYCVRKTMTIAIRSTYYIFCCRNKEWESPDLLTIWNIWLPCIFIHFHVFSFVIIISS